MAQTTNDIKNGSVLNLDGQLWTVIKFQHVKPGKGPAFVRTTIKNVLSGKIVDKTFNAGMKMEFETVDNRNLQYSYEDGDNFVFMDMTTYDQIFIPKTLVGDQAKFLLEGTDCVVSFHDGTPLSVELPASVVLTVTHTEPGLQGNRSNAGTKPATVETGAEIQVPLFIGEGEKVKVNTTDGSYLGRENRTSCPFLLSASSSPALRPRCLTMRLKSFVVWRSIFPPSTPRLTSIPLVGRSSAWGSSTAIFCVSPRGRSCSMMTSPIWWPLTRPWALPSRCAMTIRRHSSMVCSAR